MNQAVLKGKAVSVCPLDSPDCCVEEVGQTVQHLVRVMQLFERDQIKPHGFTTSQAYVLTQLNAVPELTMNELSEKLNARTSTMTRIVNNLVRDGFIQRKRDDSDRRIVLVALTSKGKKAATDLESDIVAYYQKIVAHLPEGRVEEVLRATALLVEAFDKANPNCC
ncbi:MAG: MarR family winged helix-turn-helix transcriptional regulator [Bacillota bacterium]|nr:MarR family winged helix-turn-helix transcriptional regulator [Bacillota bacterium]MDW7677993.1 MarR family winged helix-turn-helix transcriptional regulator [Bacillota bacterium]